MGGFEVEKVHFIGILSDRQIVTLKSLQTLVPNAVYITDWEGGWSRLPYPYETVDLVFDSTKSPFSPSLSFNL